MLSTTLKADDLPGEGATPAADFWQKLEPQLPSQPPATAVVEIGPVLRRWLPGLSLLMVNGLVQVVGGVVVLWLWLSPQLPVGSNWVSTIGDLLIGSVLGLPAWLLPAGWANLGITVFFVMISAWLAVLYLAWLGYELRYGTSTRARVSAA